MNELLKTLYWNLYIPYENQETEQELDDCHMQLIEVLGKPERKLVLRIIDGKDRLADEIGLDSFIFGFKLATQLAHELKKYDGHLRSEQTADDVSVLYDIEKAMSEISGYCAANGCHAEYVPFQLQDKKLIEFKYNSHNEYTRLLEYAYSFACAPTDALGKH